jgi:hypothetical protein
MDPPTTPHHNTTLSPGRLATRSTDAALLVAISRSKSGTYYYGQVNNDRKHAPAKAIEDYCEHLSCY